MPVSRVPCVATFPLCVALDPRPPLFSMLSSPLPQQVAAEVRKLRQAQCAFEIVDPAQAWKEELANHQAAEEAAAKNRSTSGDGGSSGVGNEKAQQMPPPWRRALGLPSWNSCFRCLFSCGTFRNTSVEVRATNVPPTGTEANVSYIRPAGLSYCGGGRHLTSLIFNLPSPSQPSSLW